MEERISKTQRCRLGEVLSKNMNSLLLSNKGSPLFDTISPCSIQRKKLKHKLEKLNSKFHQLLILIIVTKHNSKFQH